MTPPARIPLPKRRPALTRAFEMDGQTIDATAGFAFGAGGRPVPREVFIRDRKEGSQLSALLDDASVVISVALQHGVPPAALAKSAGRVPVETLAPARMDAWLDRASYGGKPPASLIGAVLDWLVELAGAGGSEAPGSPGADRGPREPDAPEGAAADGKEKGKKR